ncbi:hypothetical protein NC651_018895 [Populus alba x Populus x berolinensis]|nr:hypothetical protein NC651_018895 [Populus alba x Populus x berolinensis]
MEVTGGLFSDTVFRSLSFQGLEFTESFTEKRRQDPTESSLFVLQNQLPSPAFLWLESSLRVFSLIVPVPLKEILHAFRVCHSYHKHSEICFPRQNQLLFICIAF